MLMRLRLFDGKGRAFGKKNRSLLPVMAQQGNLSAEHFGLNDTVGVIEIGRDLRTPVSVSLGFLSAVRVDRNHGEQSAASGLASGRSEGFEGEESFFRTNLGRLQVQHPMFNVRQRCVGLGGAQAIAYLFEFRPSLKSEPSRSFDCSFGMFDPTSQEETLSSSEGLLKGGEVTFASGHVLSCTLEIAEEVADLGEHSLCLRLSEFVAELLEGVQCGLRRLLSFYRIAKIRTDMTEHSLAVGDVLAIADLRKRFETSFDVFFRLACASHVT
jgi:hypothetical protein